MKGNANVITFLNKLLTCELTSVDVYFIQSQIYKDWGYTKLFERFDGEKNHEGLHATALIQRILFLEGAPDIASRTGFKVETDVNKMMKLALDFEHSNLVLLKEGINLCEKESDFVTRDTLITLLKDTEEDHILWIEIQIELIGKIGLNNYLQTMSA
jgi:bacterioferritin